MQNEITLHEMQQIELDLLIYLKKICDENQLKYYLAYGTLIGAVRHQGFIPWDDDVDVMMPRKDYKKLVQIMRDQTHPYYQLVSTDTYSNFTAPLPKIIDTRTVLEQHYDFVERVPLGIYIDVFIIDGMTDEFETAVTLRKKSLKLYRRWRRADAVLFPPGKSKLYGLLRSVRNIPYKLYGITRSLKKLEQHTGTFSFYNCTYVAVQNEGIDEGVMPEKQILKREWFGEGTDLPFEGTMFRVPTEYDMILRMQYGDYMTPPPAEEQKSTHSYTVYWRD